MVALNFETGPSLKIHRDLLDLNPKLAQLAAGGGTDPRTGKRFPTPLSDTLQCNSQAAGHVLVHYLYTSTYRTPKWTGPTDTFQETTAKLRIAFEVYATARELDLSELESLAIDEITFLCKDINAFTIIDIAENAYPVADDNDTWFPVFVKNTIRTAFETTLAPPVVEAAGDTTQHDASGEQQTTKGVALSELLLQGAVEVYREKMDVCTSMFNPQPQLEAPMPKSIAERQRIEKEPEIPSEPYPEPEPEKKEDDYGWGVPTKGKKGKEKKKKGKSVDPKPEDCKEPKVEPEAVKEAAAMEEPATAAEAPQPTAQPPPADSPVGEDWVGDGQDPWSFWGARRSSRSSV